ncbi:hypothetical protein BGZ54_000835, partial [Gamsiella multidivaricata]
VQAALLARLCNRYHDLGAFASEPLQQRIHFLVKPDASNLRDLLIWDFPAFTATGADPTTTTATATTNPTTPASWTPVQMQDFIDQHWSADQLPLDPPSCFSRSWETTPVLVKALDPETVQAIVPIGQQDGTILVIVLLAELDRNQNSPATESVWKYHNMVTVPAQVDLQTRGWNLLTDQSQLPITIEKPPEQVSFDSKEECTKEEEEEEDDEDDDDDYWGQYGDAADDSSAEETVDQEQAPKRPSDATIPNVTTQDDDDDDDDYWRKYAERQEEHEKLERKRQLQLQQQEQEQQQQQQQQQLRDHDSTVEETIAATHEQDIKAGLLPTSSTPLGHVDPTMLSSLLDMLIEKSGQLPPDSPSLPTETVPSQEQLQDMMPGHTRIPAHASVVVTPNTGTSSFSRDESARTRVFQSLRSAAQQAMLAGLSKDDVFGILSNVYDSFE